jgi:hypothetical protein
MYREAVYDNMKNTVIQTPRRGRRALQLPQQLRFVSGFMPMRKIIAFSYGTVFCPYRPLTLLASKAGCAHPAQKHKNPRSRLFVFLLLVGLPPKPAGDRASATSAKPPVGVCLGGLRRPYQQEKMNLTGHRGHGQSFPVGDGGGDKAGDGGFPQPSVPLQDGYRAKRDIRFTQPLHGFRLEVADAFNFECCHKGIPS